MHLWILDSRRETAASVKSSGLWASDSIMQRSRVLGKKVSPLVDQLCLSRSFPRPASLFQHWLFPSFPMGHGNGGVDEDPPCIHLPLERDIPRNLFGLILPLKSECIHYRTCLRWLWTSGRIRGTFISHHGSGSDQMTTNESVSVSTR